MKTLFFRKYTIIFLLFILLGGFLLRLYKITNPVADWHSFRQADTASVSWFYYKNGINLLYPKYHDISTTQSGLFNPEGYRYVEFPLGNAIHALSYKYFPQMSFDIWGRVLSAIYAILTGLMVYLLGSLVFSSGIGLVAAFFYLFIPYNIYFTRVILPDPLAVFLATTGLYFFTRFSLHDNKHALFVSGLVFALALLVKPFSFFFLLPCIYMTFKKERIKVAIKNRQLWIFALIILIPFVAWRMWISQFPEGIPFFKWMLNGDGIRFRPAFWYWIFGERLGLMILGAWGIVPFIFALFPRYKYKDLILSFLFSITVYIGVFATVNVKHDYYQTMIIPFIALTLGVGFVNLWNITEFDVRLTRMFLIICVFFMLLVGGFKVKDFYQINRPELIEVGARVQELIPEDALIIAPYNGDTAFLYQTKRRGWPVVDRPIDELIAKGAHYFVSVDLGHYQTVEFEKRFITIEKTKMYIILDLFSPLSETTSHL